ncbi:hypothetical protein ACTJI2_02175 [Pseudoxanthomonas sp. 22568]
MLRSCTAKMLLGSMIAWTGFSQPASAQTQKETHEEYAKQIKTAEAIGALGNDLFGEQVNLYTGSLSFTVTDVSLRGNNALPVEIRRSFKVESRDSLYSQGAFGDWELDIPYLYGTFARKTLSSEVGWQVRTLTPNARCSVNVNTAMPPDAEASGSGSGNYFEAEEFWAGNSLHLPEGGDQEMLLVASENPSKPADGATYYWTTSGHWFFSCLANTANGISGEAFLARGPDGTTYRFDYPVKRTAPSLMRRIYSATEGFSASAAAPPADGIIVQPMAANELILNRQEVRILPTRVTDRFGNWVDYTYDAAVAGRLNRISSSDGRQIDLTYNANGQIATATAGTRTWTYAYTTDTTGTALTTVTLPDNGRWSYSLAGLRTLYVTYLPDTTTCESAGDVGGSGGTGTLTHPSGASGSFTVNWVRHGRSYVPNGCVMGGGGRVRYAVIPQTFDTPSLTSKQISGPGITTATWTYAYSAPTGSWSQSCPTPTSCVRTKTVTVNGPGEWLRYTFGTKVFEDEGKLLKTERGGSASALLRTDETTYQLSATGMAYPPLLGRSPNGRGDGMSQYHAPQRKVVTTQQGTVFTWQVDATCGGNGTTLCFDTFARPIKVTRSSAPSP